MASVPAASPRHMERRHILLGRRIDREEWIMGIVLRVMSKSVCCILTIVLCVYVTGCGPSDPLMTGWVYQARAENAKCTVWGRIAVIGSPDGTPQPRYIGGPVFRITCQGGHLCELRTPRNDPAAWEVLVYRDSELLEIVHFQRVSVGGPLGRWPGDLQSSGPSSLP